MTILDCGHVPSPHSASTTGTAHTPAGREICLTCANDQELIAFLSSDRYLAYLSSDAKTITTWPGGHLAYVTRTRKRTAFTPSGGWYERWDVWARGPVDETGKHRTWYGVGIGPGCYVRLRRTRG